MAELFIAVMTSAATIGLVVAAALWSWRVFRGVGRGWQRPGAGAAAVGVMAGYVVAVRLCLGGWPAFPATSSADWLVWVGIGAGIVSWASAWRGVAAGLSGAVVGVAVGTAVVVWPLASGISRQVESDGLRWAWRAGVPVVFGVLGAIAGAACAAGHGAGNEQRGRSLIARLREEQWGTVALGLAIGVSAPAMIFSASIKVGQCAVGLAMAWLGVATVALLGRMPAATGAAAAVSMLGAMWLIVLFYASSSAAALALGALAPASLLVGLAGPMRRGGWRRFIVVTALAAGLAGAATGVMANRYFESDDETGGYEYGGVEGTTDRAGLRV